ncbi:hypothetical protein FHS43_005923 [Streptosporangium becharense]|uniref:Uncharacterized protein n=1 Tax=Streptosporangium becharense TaxID=1816182 RepID=A0A7W9IMS7_9ACTN|nr:DUF6098 family protein [Streptosporangium becharense]MBB2914611.1 hypothetical protein [Streptosporangium becharense]MBB5823456.1 hypothetical protein [Streptosporangium becharense]
MGSGIPVIASLSELVELLGTRQGLFIRWSPELDRDVVGGCSRDALTGAPLPGLSANPLDVESWWGDRSPRLWAARRLYDYSHIREHRGPGVRAWVLAGEEVGRGPDNEPLIECHEVLGAVDDAVMKEAYDLVSAQRSEVWGTLDRQRRPG